MCLCVQSYKIPPATHIKFLISVVGGTCNDWVSLTQFPGDSCNYPVKATWAPLIADDAWHYKCINLAEVRCS